jgi:hypothetical protein
VNGIRSQKGGEGGIRDRVGDPWLVIILLVAALLFLAQLAWGLPNGNHSWAADAIGPVTTLGIVYRSFAQWNSGWYFFKYPLGYPFLLFLVASPYLAWSYLTGQWRAPKADYPYGFEDPERALFAISMAGRLLSVAFALGVVAVTYGIANRLLGRWPARLAAFAMATAYPIIYYAHTTNLDIGYLFWLLLALYAAIVAADSKRMAPWLILGVAAAMAVSSKEQGFAFLLPLPFLSVGKLVRADGWRAIWSRNPIAMACGAIGTVVLANNIWFNPLGFVARIAYLLGRPLEPVSARLAPVEFALWKGSKEWVYLRQTWDGIESTLGLALLCLGIAGIGVLLWRHARAAVWLLVPAFSQYYLSLRGLDLITLRYLLPISAIVAIAAGVALETVFRLCRTRRARAGALAVTVSVVGLSAARAVETQWLFATDSRYRAERWLDEHLRPGAVVEYYQKETYVPRFLGDVRGHFIEMGDRSVAGLRQRNPDAIVLSSASRKSIAHIWNPDWRETRDLLTPVAEAIELKQAIERQTLGYRKAVTIGQEPRLLRLRITSLAPEITIYVRE